MQNICKNGSYIPSDVSGKNEKLSWRNKIKILEMKKNGIKTKLQKWKLSSEVQLMSLMEFCAP